MLILFQPWRMPDEWIDVACGCCNSHDDDATTPLERVEKQVWEFYTAWKRKLKELALSDTAAHFVKTPEVYWARESLPRMRMLESVCASPVAGYQEQMPRCQQLLWLRGSGSHRCLGGAQGELLQPQIVLL